MKHVVDSIANDRVYNKSRGQIKTITHVQPALGVKRKSRFVHRISYTDAIFLKLNYADVYFLKLNYADVYFLKLN